jgi:hypothetical protein
MALFLIASLPAQAQPVPVRVAVFDFELVDSSLQAELEGEQPEDLARLELVQAELVQQLEAAEQYELVATDPAAEAIAAAGYLHGCNGCEAPIAAELGADLALIGWVQKVSNMIININVGMRDATSRERVFSASVDIRGNTDEAWLRGIRYLLEHRLFAAETSPLR